MRQSLIKRLEALSPSLEASEVVVDQLIKQLEAVKPDPGEATALVHRMKHGTSNESDRQRLLEILEAEEATLKFLASWHPPSLPNHGQHRKKRTKPRVKRSRRQHRRERQGGLTSHGCCVPSPVLMPGSIDVSVVRSGDVSP